MTRILALLCLLLTLVVPMKTQAANLTIAIGSVPGGGPDISARLIAKYMGKHMPGTNVVVQNMPGGGGLIVANWLYNVADPETTIGSFTVLNNTLLNALTGNEKVKFDPLKFHWLFSSADGADNAIILWANDRRGLKNITQLMHDNEFIIGSQSAGDVSIQQIILKDVMRIKSKFVVGYKDIVQAITNNEIDAYIGTLQSAKTTRPEWLTGKSEIHPILQLGRTTKHPDLPNVPLLLPSMLADKKMAGVLDFFNKQVRLARIMVAPPAASPETVKRYIDVAHKIEMDPEYQADVKRLNLETRFIHSMELEVIVRQLTQTPADVLDTIKSLSEPAK